MLIFLAILFLGVSTKACTLIRSNYCITIENDILKDVYSTSALSDELDLSGLGLKKIDEKANLDSLSEIRNLSLANNHLSRLQPLIFYSLFNLEHLSLANNNLKQLQYAFYTLPHLRTLDIRNNNMKVLYTGSFYGLPDNTEILIDGNDFGPLKDDHFKKPFPLLEVCMDDGVIQYVKDFDSEYDEKIENANCPKIFRPLLYDILSLGMEGIRGFAEGWYRLGDLNVTFLDLQFNEIDEITSEMLNDLPERLTGVNLSWNKITKVKEDVIVNYFLRHLDLRENRISVIEDDAFAKTNLNEMIHGENGFVFDSEERPIFEEF
ncbi:leucine-rich repeats and immunoglobulin-like domains protein 2 [Venturia canescens]|uniref:leucine-rich repeats and immunoglobulin-like domains protein 2 n=1 Tax=Venturia canescens TaxID=32260 RepID=UPI001C9C6986|nr:leucine-rich repeats and immunoglobulin-like domains protein 2 [Venturia canescens]